jgi:hypothetical protein
MKIDSSLNLFMMLDLVHSNRLRYLESSFVVKRSIIAEVVKIIETKGGRFVRLKDAVWSIVPESISRVKVAHAIQYHIRTEFTQSIEDSSSMAYDTASLTLVPRKLLSDQDRVIRSIQEQISKLQNELTPQAQCTSYSASINRSSMYHRGSDSSRQYSNMTEGVVVREVKTPPRRVSIHGDHLVPPCMQKVLQPPTTEFDQFMNGRQLNTFALQKQPPFATPMPSTRYSLTKNIARTDDPIHHEIGRYMPFVRRRNSVPLSPPQITGYRINPILEYTYTAPKSALEYSYSPGTGSLSGTGNEAYHMNGFVCDVQNHAIVNDPQATPPPKVSIDRRNNCNFDKISLSVDPNSNRNITENERWTNLP